MAAGAEMQYIKSNDAFALLLLQVYSVTSSICVNDNLDYAFVVRPFSLDSAQSFVQYAHQLLVHQLAAHRCIRCTRRLSLPNPVRVLTKYCIRDNPSRTHQFRIQSESFVLVILTESGIILSFEQLHFAQAWTGIDSIVALFAPSLFFVPVFRYSRLVAVFASLRAV